MRVRGIIYDTGFVNPAALTPEGRTESSRVHFDVGVVRRELEIIRDDLRCTAVRVTGTDPERMETAAMAAAELGLEVWFSPFPCDLAVGELLELFGDCAERAERVRATGAEVVFVTGAELALLASGFLPGDTLAERMDGLVRRDPLVLRHFAAVPALMNDFLGKAVAVVRERFGGKVTYASLPLEGVDWERFDIIGVDAYRTAEVAGIYAESIRRMAAQGKPLAITEFGSATYVGAGDQGARGGMVIEWDGPTPARLDGEYTRDENEQVVYLRELVDVFTAAGVDAAFWCTFAQYNLPHRDDPRGDLDMAGYGVVKMVGGPGLGWEPKAVFAAMAECYRG